MTDYCEASLTYDNTRTSDDEVIDLFARKFDFRSGVPFLDFGCGTGNYLARIYARYGAEGYGTEPSDGMRRIAVTKNPDIEVRKGDHTSTGFPSGMFGFAYMTDVIHHVSDTGILFATLFAGLKPGGLLAILTESHAQLGTRWYNRYFPSLLESELARYPDVPAIERVAALAGFVVLSRDIRATGESVVSDDFIATVREKNYSMFRNLDAREWAAGLEALELDRGHEIPATGHGETIVWLKKKLFN